ncbi:hypothetical protein HYH02_005158 [Chlamydomonas schloesseri]|uniref:Uncharacterized protein n=1 Tax=Chlamydomonas schloesseri TaxID=2026947 RepID=A0A835WMY1_9CHLO|nr:hypothetical protein HYH02_005158 [Chlamydomonas schloesseri]|eukprot:KAG2449625.1 hypothetical protein HYH02_005158 [Chlamydomonas schloesseri]
MSDMPLEQRRKLLCATAASGNLENLELAVSVVGCPLGPDVFTAAMSSPACDQVAAWLLQRRCRVAVAPALEALARAGRMHGDPLFDDVFSRGKFSMSLDNLLPHIAAAGAGYVTDKFARMVDMWRNNPLHLEAAIAAARGDHAQLVHHILNLPNSSTWVGLPSLPSGPAAAAAVAASASPGPTLPAAVVGGGSDHATPSSAPPAVSRSCSVQGRANEEQVRAAALRLLEAVVEGLPLEDMAAVYAAWFDPSDPAYRNPVWQVLPRSSGRRGSCSGCSSRAISPSPTRLDFSALVIDDEASGAREGKGGGAAATEEGGGRDFREREAPPLDPAGPQQAPDTTQAAALEHKAHVDKLLLAAAAGSRTVDWRAKVIWLLGKGHMPQQSAHHAQAAARAAACPDALERLQWLHAYRGPQDGSAASQFRFPVCYPRVAAQALSNGRTDALRYVLQLAGAHGMPAAGAAAGPQDGTPAQELLDALASEQGLLEAAAAGGQLEGLQLLHAAGCRMPYQALALAAARHGHVNLLRWLLDVWLSAPVSLQVPCPAPTPELDPGVQLVPALCAAAARSGSLEALRLLRARGCPWDADAIVAGAEAGCEAVLEYLVAEGCPAPADDRVYAAPLAAEDLLTLRCLRRLGLPFRREPAVFARALAAKHSLALLKWLYETGVPVDLEAHLERALDSNVRDPDWEAWLQAELETKRQRQQEQEAELQAGKSKGAKFASAMKRALSIKRRNAPQQQQQPKQPHQPGTRMYAAPLAAEDLLTLRCLRRIGLPFRRERDTFMFAVAVFHSLPVLQ